MASTRARIDSGETDEKTPLLYKIDSRVARHIDLLEDGGLNVLSLSPQEQTSERKGRKRQRIFSILLFMVLAYALLRRVIPYTSSWICLSASRFFLISTAKCALPGWYDVQPDRNGAFVPSNTSAIIPQYVRDYAPFVHLFSDEKFWPCDMSEHLTHTTPELDYTPIDIGEDDLLNLTLSNLDKLNGYGEHHSVFLTSNEDVEARPSWLIGAKHKPTPFNRSTTSPSHSQPFFSSKPTTRTTGGRSSAPAILITVPKPNGILDAFYFFFYSYNHGNEVLRLRFGNHVGDWEHTMIRFQRGKPKAVFFSEHNFGSAYAYSAVEKIGKRPVLYSATGTHAMYATPGLQPYILPLGLLHDRTDRGPVWDPEQNLMSYTYDYTTDVLTAAESNVGAPTQWFYFKGHWGDKHYPIVDKRQYSFLGEYHYVNGPLGPRFKHLGRRKVCQGPYEEPCELRHWLGGGGLQAGKSEGDGDWPVGEVGLGQEESGVR